MWFSVYIPLLSFQEGARYHLGHEVDVPMEIPAEVDEVSAAVYDPDGNLEKSTFRKDPDGLFHLKFIPTKIGQHKVSGDSYCAGH